MSIRKHPSRPKRTVHFASPPTIWYITYTDCFCCNTLSDREDLVEVIAEVASETANAEVVEIPQDAQLFTSDQVVVELLREKLYGREIAFTHVHMPNPHDVSF